MDSTVLSEEWKYAKHAPESFDLCLLASCGRLRATFPTLSQLAVRLVLLPVGTASCKRSFSTVNRVLNSKRSNLTAEHLEQLLFLTHEGPQIPHPRSSGTVAENVNETFSVFLVSVYKEYMTYRHRI